MHMSNETKDKIMTLERKRALVPKRRFPEFRDDDAWQIKPFRKLFSIGNGRDYKHLSIGNIPVYGSGGYMLSVDEYLYDGESVCIGRKGTINNPMFLTGKFWTVDTLFYTHSFNECLPKFIYAIFQGIDWLKHNEAGGVPSLSKTNIEKIEVAVPKPIEQQKIADCVSSIEELISLEAQKLAMLKIHKNGLMQKLFPAENATLPQLRFPEFRDAGKWEEKPLSDLISSLDAGVSVNSGDRPATVGQIGVLKTSAVTNGTFEPGENKVVFEKEEIERVKESVLGDTIIISRMNTPALVGANAYVKTSIENIFLPDRLWAAKAKADASMRFIAFILGSDKGRAALSKLAKGTSGSMKNITKPDVLALLVTVPNTVAEQSRIADCLIFLDDLVANQIQKLATLKAHKQGLLQQLFPVMDEEGV